MEQKLLREQEVKQVAAAAKQGDAAAPRHAIVVAGPVGALTVKSAKPPRPPQGATRRALGGAR